MTARSSWPYVARPALAAHYLDRPKLSGQRAITLFGARGIGKTEFLVRDLEPLAIERGYRVVHVDLQTHQDQPGIALVTAMAQATRQPISPSSASARTKSIKLDASLTGIGLGLELGPRDTDPKETLLERLRHAFYKLKASERKPVLLVIDEVQVLADPRHADLLAALRAHLQAQDEGILRVFTGSSRAGLDRAFRRAKSPLFGQGGVQDQFPLLGRPFLQAVSLWFKDRTGGQSLELADLELAFTQLKGSARHLREAVGSVLLGNFPTLNQATEHLRRHSPDRDASVAMIQRLTPIEQAVLHAAYLQTPNVFSDDAIDFKRYGVNEPPAASTIQSALRSLERKNMIYRVARGQYALESIDIEMGFEAWLTAA